MNYLEMKKHIAKLSDFLNSDGIKVTMKEVFSPHNAPYIGDRTDDTKDAIPYPPSSKISKTSGIYCFVYEDDTVIYIGKATQNNARNRIWDHLKTPTVPNEKGWSTFPNNKFNDELVLKGKVKVGIFEIEPADYSSLVEVYLHTIELPKYCKQIG